MSFKPLFARSLGAAPGRLHFAAHSHHLWPDASFAGQVECWDDAARLADSKWDRIMGEVYPAAQVEVAAELGTGMAEAVAFAPNTHDLILRLVSACPRRSGQLRILTSDGEFHSARRQFARWEEDGWLAVERIAAEPFDSFSQRFLARARSGDHDLVFVSQVLFSSGRLFGQVPALAAIANPAGPWVAIDGYHAFMAIEKPLPAASARSCFYLGGGYKYAMAGEGCAFLHAPPGFGPRPAVTGWFAEFDDITQPPGSVGYAPDGRRFLGATFDSSGLYRFNAVRRMLAQNELSTERVAALCDTLKRRLIDGLHGTPLGTAEMLNPPGDGPQARFLALRHPRARALEKALRARHCITDVRGDVLRIGFAVYQDEDDVDRFVDLARKLA